MSRVLGDVVGRVGEEVQVERGPHGPVRFWRGHSRYEVGELLDSWMETPAWWRREAVGGASDELVATREVWRGGGGGGRGGRGGVPRGPPPARGPPGQPRGPPRG